MVKSRVEGVGGGGGGLEKKSAGGEGGGGRGGRVKETESGRMDEVGVGGGAIRDVSLSCKAGCTPTSAVSNDAREPDDDHLNTCYS